MNKNVIALAVAAAMAAPLAAQADVKVSGLLQAEVVSVDSDLQDDGILMQDASTMGASNGHNAGGLFFTASEDLGNGMKAIAKYGFNIDTQGRNEGGATGKSARRDAYIGLTGGFGTVLAGRMSSPYKMSTVKWDPFLATFMQARGNGGASAGALGHGSYLDNVVAYANKFGMAKVVAGVSFDEKSDADATDPATTGNHAVTVSVNMPVGPVEIAIGYLNATDMGSATSDAHDSSETKIGVKYSAGAITVAGQFEMRDAGLQGGTIGTLGALTGALAADITAAKANADGETYMLVTGSYAMGANTLSASYGMNSMTFSGGDDDIETTYMAIGVKHAFSKKTSVHAGYRATSVDTGSSLDETVIGAGMRVKF